MHIREAQGHDALTRLRGGDIDVLITDLLIASPPDLTAGPVLLSEKKMLAVAAGHALAQHASVSMEALADHPVTLVAEQLPEAFQRDRNPTHTPAGKPIPRGPRAASFNDASPLSKRTGPSHLGGRLGVCPTSGTRTAPGAANARGRRSLRPPAR